MAIYPYQDADASHQFWQAVRAARAAETHEPSVDLSSLDTDARRRVWRYLKQHYPAYADLLQSPLVQAMRAHFDARVYLRQSLVDEALHGQH